MWLKTFATLLVVYFIYTIIYSVYIDTFSMIKNIEENMFINSKCVDMEVNHLKFKMEYLEIENHNKLTLIFIHGCASSSLLFLNYLKELSKSYHVIGLDLPGFGKYHVDFTYEKLKELYPKNTSLFYVDVIKHFVDCLKLKNVILCGHSYGGYISTIAAEKYKKTISGLILLSPIGMFPILGNWGSYWGLVFANSIPNIGKFFGNIATFLSTFLYKEERIVALIANNPKAFGDQIIKERITIDLLNDNVFWNDPLYHSLILISNRYKIQFIYGIEDNIIPYRQGYFLSKNLNGLFCYIHNQGHFLSKNPKHINNICSRIKKYTSFKSQDKKCASKLDIFKYKSSFIPWETEKTIYQMYNDLNT
jgi:pimeloyl-ACP methyl ester carboxylesterase